MASKRKKNTPAKEAGILENPEALAEKLSKTEQFIENNKILVSSIFIGILIVVGGFFGYRYYINTLNEEAQSEMFQAIFYYENDSLTQALRGDGNNLGFVDIAEDYSNTKAGNLANFYAGTIFLAQGEYDLAIMFLEDFSSKDILMQSRVLSNLGDAYAEKGEFEKAVSYYLEAAHTNENKEFSPIYLLKAAVAQEESGDKEAAKESYKEIIDQYWEATEAYQKARIQYARLGGVE